MTTMKVKFTKLRPGHIDADCVVCVHGSVCFRCKALQDLKLPTPYAVYFDCEHWEAEKE